MEYKSFLIRCDEIGVKGKNRYRFEDALVRQFSLAPKPLSSTFHIVREHGRIYVDIGGAYDYEDTIAVLQRVFDVVSICPVLRLMEWSEDAIATETVRFLREITVDEAKSFKIFTRRINKNYPGTSEEVNASFGAVLLGACPSLHIGVRNPEIRLNPEIRNEGILFYTLSIPGPGGMPVDITGHVMLPLLGDIDPPVTGYTIAKRGVQLEATYFHAPSCALERAKQEVVGLARILARHVRPMHLRTVNLMDIQLYIYEKYPREELTIIMRHYMMRIAETIVKKNKGMVSVTGRSIGQVTNQTAPPLLSINEVCALSVFRPLIGFDKQEIIERAEKMGSYETPTPPFEDCCMIFVTKHPVTNPELSRIKKSKEKFAERIEELVKTALRTEEIMLCEV